MHLSHGEFYFSRQLRPHVTILVSENNFVFNRDDILLLFYNKSWSWSLKT
jgi:hypothetical protein